LTLEDYYLLAQGLGLLNGVFLVDHPLPSAPWLDSEGIRKYLERATPVVNQLFENRTLTLVQRVFPPDAIDSFIELWHSRQQHLQTLSRLPQTLCHGDAQVSNLFLHSRPSGQPETVAIDWTHVGLGAIGCDLGQLISFSLGTGKVDFALADALDQAIFQGYLAGLNTAGWQGDPRVVRLGYTAAALKSRTTVVIRSLPSLIDERVHRQVEQRLKSQGLAFDNILETVFHSALFLEKLFHESLELRDQLL
jgi:hypothetical protein